MKKFNLLPQTILLIVAFIAFNFTSKNTANLEKKQQTTTVATSTYYTHTLSILYNNGLTPMEKAQARQCFSSYLNVLITDVMDCDINENVDILTLAVKVVVPGVGINPPDDANQEDEQKEEFILYSQVVEAVNACPNIIVAAPGTSSCKRSAPVDR